MVSPTKFRWLTASIALGAATAAASLAFGQNAPQRALDMPGGGQDNCHVRPDGKREPSEPLANRLQDCNSVLKPKGLGDPDIVTAPPKVNDPMAIQPPSPATPAAPGYAEPEGAPASP